jgi:hypothetical protein
MNKTNKILGSLLVAQVVLIGLTWTTCQTKPPVTGAKPIFDFKSVRVTAMTVTSPGDKGKPPETVKLVKKGDKWVVETAEDYPAKGENIVKVLDNLTRLKIREPIANNPANHRALKVADKQHDRKIMLKTALVTKSIIAGSGSGQSMHIRFEGDNNVYQAQGTTVWAIPSTTRSYIETKFIEIDKDKLTSVMIANPKGKLTFTKEGDSWKLNELPAGAKLDDSKVKTLIDKARKVTINEPIGKTLKPEYGLPGDTEVVLVSTEDDTTKTTRYMIGGQKGDQHYYLKSDDNDYVVTISKYDTNQLRDKAVDDFIKKEKEEKKDADKNKDKDKGKEKGKGKGKGKSKK